MSRWKKPLLRTIPIVMMVWALMGGVFTAHAAVLVQPNPTVAIVEKTLTVDLGAVEGTDFFANVIFTVTANTERVTIFLEASDLWKNGEPAKQGGPKPIEVNTGRPASIIPQIGRRVTGASETLAWRDKGVNSGRAGSNIPQIGRRVTGASETLAWRDKGEMIAGFPTKKTEMATYESGQSGQFAGDILCKIWFSKAGLRTAGQYSGKVRLSIRAAPPGRQ